MNHVVTAHDSADSWFESEFALGHKPLIRGDSRNRYKLSGKTSTGQKVDTARKPLQVNCPLVVRVKAWRIDEAERFNASQKVDVKKTSEALRRQMTKGEKASKAFRHSSQVQSYKHYESFARNRVIKHSRLRFRCVNPECKTWVSRRFNERLMRSIHLHDAKVLSGEKSVNPLVTAKCLDCGESLALKRVVS